MKKSITLFLLILLLTGGLFGQQKSATQPKTLALTHVTVVDVIAAQNRPDMTVVITGDRMTEIGRTGQVKIPPDAQVIEAAGKFLIPGLWDMHVHAANRETTFPLFVVNGVTGVREMGGPTPEQVNQWRREYAQGTALAPRLVAAGLIVDGPQPIWPFSIPVSNESEGRQAVTTLKQRGADFIKVYSLLPREGYFAVARQAKQSGLPFAGHVPAGVSAAEASNAGQASIEHLDSVFLDALKEETELRRKLVESLSAPNPAPAFRRAQNETLLKAMETHDPAKAAALFDLFRRNGTWQVPTLTILGAFTFIDDLGASEDPRMKYLPTAIKNRWSNSRPRNQSPEAMAMRKRLFQQQLDLVRAMREKGVALMAGTDTPNPNCFPGFGLHAELALLVRAGLTPAQALQTATHHPAKFLGLLDRLGTIEPGKLADLVLLEADPLKEINHTTLIDAVILNGRLITKRERQETLLKIEAASNAK